MLLIENKITSTKKDFGKNNFIYFWLSLVKFYKNHSKKRAEKISP
jgi:hypothetical protein